MSVIASRAFHNKGETDIRSIHVGNVDAIVAGGQFSGTFPIDERDLLAFVGKGPGDDQIDKVDRDLTVCAEFQTGSDIVNGTPRQPPSVSAIVGPNGEALAGSPQVYVFGSATKTPANWLQVMSDLALHSLKFDQLTAQQGFAADEVALDGFCLS